jgi:hypothetical protein
LQVGQWPTNVQAVANFTDGWGKPGQIVFPVPQVDVIAPTPTSVEPTPTSPPETPTPPPTPTPVGRPVFLPFVVRDYAMPTAGPGPGVWSFMTGGYR